MVSWNAGGLSQRLIFRVRGQRIVELFKQKQYDPFPMELEVALLWSMQNGGFDDVEVDRVKAKTRGVSITDIFDMVAGTSIGGIIAFGPLGILLGPLAIVLGIAMLRAYEEAARPFLEYMDGR